MQKEKKHTPSKNPSARKDKLGATVMVAELPDAPKVENLWSSRESAGSARRSPILL